MGLPRFTLTAMAPDLLSDPETDPTATYAVDPGLARRLTARVVCTPRARTALTHTPMTGAPLASLPLSTLADVTVAYAGARAAQRSWSRMPMKHRARIFLRFHDLVLQRQVQLLDLIQLESGKARSHAFEEVADTAIVSRHYARRAAVYLRPRRRQGAFPFFSQAVELRHPKGVVGIVAPWNYPLSMSITDAIPALLAGNAVVLRPDIQSALTALQAVSLLDEAGLPEGLLQVVLGGGPRVGSAVFELADYVAFTGSTATGRSVAQNAARRLVGASLELGGKNAMYVAEDANITKAVAGAVRACFSSAGQLCVAIERLYLHQGIADEFLADFVAAVRSMRLSPDLTFNADMGSLVSAAQLERVSAHVEDARSKGALVLAGGRARPEIGPYFYEPTVLAEVTAAMACRDDETFGPVVSVYRVGSDEEAIRRANDSDFGLNASVWTRDVAHGRRIARSIKVGTVSINDGYAAAWASVGAPMGGMKSSGLSRRHGIEGITKYTESQNVTAQHFVGFAPPFGLSDERWARTLTVALGAMKRLGVR
jgi:succinate-semialdehyde dehydrogenase / glutarate-semialdehyde dehydrogenase